MSFNLMGHRQEFYKALMECITELTDIPISLYEIHDGEIVGVIPETSRSNYEKHCKLIQSFPGGKNRCEEDQIKRAKEAFNSDRGRTKECCWAGVYNESVPIKIGGKPRALLVYGEMQLDGENHIRQSLAKHQQAVNKLHLSESQAAELRASLLNVKKYSPQSFSKVEKLISKGDQWMQSMIEEEKKAKDAIERNTHEINTRLQSVIAHAENLILQIESSDLIEAKRSADAVLNSTETLDTVIQNLGDYLEAYQFKRQPLTPLVEEAVSFYRAEATLKDVDIAVRLSGADSSANWVDVSARHLQFALNNLIHNAVKYSFRGGVNRYRYVDIEGHPDKNSYRLKISNYGIGILPEEFEKIFQDGYQGILTRDEYRTGAGKGLRFVKRTIESHKGKIEVESRLRYEKETPEGKPHINNFVIWLPYSQAKGI